MDSSDPVLGALAARRCATWMRSGLPSASRVIAEASIDPAAVDRAADRLERFAPWFSRVFPETEPLGGLLESPLQRADRLRERMDSLLGLELEGSLWVKRDDALPVSGSIKARGGIHEVLELAERVAAVHGLPQHVADTFSSAEFADLAHAHRVVVGSTGNLGLSIGIVGAALGFDTTVHMSQDARRWKKDLLRERGVQVVEHSGSFSEAVDAGRAAALDDDRAHFVDDENSVSLFAGYAVAGRRLKRQLEEQDVAVDEDHPLIVYLPCGVGGGPGGVAYGLKQVFGDAVHCVFSEPLEAPAMFLGVRTGLHSDISVQDIGLTGETAADGLAVGRPSRFIGANVHGLVGGFATVSDEMMSAGVSVLHDTEGIAVEPSATAGLCLPWRGAEAVRRGLPLPWEQAERTTHILWLTGGRMVPEAEMSEYIRDGSEHLDALTAEARVFSEAL